jgi:hypothetical protein
MIIVRVSHGLGNQLFQYANGRSVSLRLDSPLKFDRDFFTRANLSNQFELSCFTHPSTIDCNMGPYADQTFTIYKEPHFHFDKAFKEAELNTYLIGFWQCEKYFREYRDVLLKDLTIKEEYVGGLSDKAAEIAGRPSVALHVRRGDYLTPPFSDLFGVLPGDYYYRAVDLLSSMCKDFKIYLFSDDIEWVKKEFTFTQEHEFVSGSITTKGIEDFYLMTHCHHHIIANSSFSWWTAWLAQHPGKIVIAPKLWFANAPFDTSDVVPESWIKI